MSKVCSTRSQFCFSVVVGQPELAENWLERNLEKTSVTRAHSSSFRELGFRSRFSIHGFVWFACPQNLAVSSTHLSEHA